MKREVLMTKEKRIIAAGEKLAAQLSGTFRIVPRKLYDFRKRG
jgi:hypothetical protein